MIAWWVWAVLGLVILGLISALKVWEWAMNNLPR
jgi:hypothetical protein